MTSSRTTSVARRPAGSVPNNITAATFTWSKGHVSVRDLVVRRLVPIPTVVRISTTYRSDKFKFYEETVSVHVVICSQFKL